MDRIDNLEARVQALETKMDQVPAMLDRRFDAVDAAIAEQRQYTEFAFDSLKTELKAELKSELGGVKGELKADIAGVRVELKAELAELRNEVRTVTSGLGRVERKLDQFIDRPMKPHGDLPDEPK